MSLSAESDGSIAQEAGVFTFACLFDDDLSHFHSVSVIKTAGEFIF